MRTKLKISNKLNKIRTRKIVERTSKMTNKESLVKIVLVLLLKISIISIFGMLILFPFYYMISGSLMSYDEISDKHDIHLKPESPQWSNFTKAFKSGYWDAISLTAIVTFISIFLKIIVTMLVGYAFSLPKWRGKKIAWGFLLSLLMLPEVALMAGQYKIVTQIEWREGIMLIGSMVIPFVASVFSGIMFRNAFEQIPTRTKEAAMVDGVSGSKFFIKIAIPMVAPTTWTVGILTAFAAWNSYMWPNILLQSTNSNHVISTWLFTTGKSTDPGETRLYLEIRLAAALLAILPMFIIYFAMRGRIMRAISRQGSAIKG